MRLPHPELIELDDALYRRTMDRMKTKLGIGVPRGGVHVSDLNQCVLKGWAKKQLESLPPGALEDDEDDQILVWVIGRSHEDIFGQGFRRGEPVNEDEIIGTVDWLDETDLFSEPMVVEMKSTRASSKKWLDEMPHYIAQAASYCCLHEQNEARVAVLHIMGDYQHQTKEGKAKKLPPRAHLKIYRIRFSDEELRAWWSEQKRRRDLILAPEKPRAEDWPELIPLYEFECVYCRVGNLVGCPNWKEGG